MEEKTLEKLVSITKTFYTSLSEQMANGYCLIWSPRLEELNEAMEELMTKYQHCKLGSVLQKQYEALLEYQKQIALHYAEIEEIDSIDAMPDLKKEYCDFFGENLEMLRRALKKYDQVQECAEQLSMYEEKFTNTSDALVEEYKLKLQNRIILNINKVRCFDSLTAEERSYFITHTLFYDEGKIEYTILRYLKEAEKKLVEDAEDIEQRAIISPQLFDMEKSREYVWLYRLESGNKDPKEKSVSKKMMKQDELENAFESWFDSLLGSESSIGKLIKEEKKIHEYPIEDQMFLAMENVIEGRLGNLKMSEMVAGYIEECIAIRDRSFLEFYGSYDEVKRLSKKLEKIFDLCERWEIREISMADAILGE